MKFKLPKTFLFMAMMSAITNIQAETTNPQESNINSPGVEVCHLGPNNTMVRVTGKGRFLMIPVQETIDDSKVDVLKNTNLDQSLNIRLARTKVDYFVPFDLSGYEGSDVLLNIITPHQKQSASEANIDVCWKNFHLSDTFEIDNIEKYRPAYHHTPLWGWMNDPNGMFYDNGVWHLYYQYNPYGSKWQNMTWGHSTSTDLVNWEHHPLAILPNGLGTVFSGSCAIDRNNTAGFGKDAVIAMYTSAGESQVQSMAWSNDNGETFQIYAANPVITLDSEARDPNMFYNETTGKWVLVLAHPLEHEMLFFTSPDMKQWTLESSFGKRTGAQGGVWECPDLFPLKVDGSGVEKWVLICNINPGGPFGGSATQYFIGDFDGTKFTADTDPRGNVSTKWADFGKDNYAGVTWSDVPGNRRVFVGWMSNWQYANEVPTQQFRSANTLPRDLGLFEHKGEIFLSSKPAVELTALRGKATVKAKSFSTNESIHKTALPSANDGICEIILTLDAKKASKMEVELSNDAGEEVVMTYDPTNKTFSFDRRKSGITDFSDDFPSVTVAPTFDTSGTVELRIFVDRSSIEVFEANGRFAMTNLVFPTKPYTTLSVKSLGSARVANLSIYSLNPQNKVN